MITMTKLTVLAIISVGTWFVAVNSLPSVKLSPGSVKGGSSSSGSNQKPFRKPWEPLEDDIPGVTTSQTTSEDLVTFPTVEEVTDYFPWPLALQTNYTDYANESFEAPDNDSLVVRQYPPLSPCTCYFQESCGCVCREPISWEDFQMLPQNFRSCPGFTLALRGGQFHSFPPDYFYKVGDVREFVLDVSRIEFQYLLDPSGSPFNRITFDTTAFIRIHQVAVNRDWNWSGFYELAPSRMLAYCEVQIVESTVPILSADFGMVCQGAVTAVSVNSCGMMALENRVFLPFYKLNDVDLSNNRLRVMLRSYFPQPANELETISLAFNDIHTLPRNMFTGMPSLKSVDLRGNPIATLEENIFRPIFRNVQIVGLESLPLACDCRVRWMKEPSQLCGVNTYALAGTVCQTPRRLHGFSFFNDTLPKDLNC